MIQNKKKNLIKQTGSLLLSWDCKHPIVERRTEGSRVTYISLLIQGLVFVNIRDSHSAGENRPSYQTKQETLHIADQVESENQKLCQKHNIIFPDGPSLSLIGIASIILIIYLSFICNVLHHHLHSFIVEIMT
jgi:hypothetical protein